MNKYTIRFEENGGEYWGHLEINTPYVLEKIDVCTIRLGNTTITLDEIILDIKEELA